MKSFYNKALKILVSLAVVCVIFILTAIIVTDRASAGKVLSQSEISQYSFKFVLVYSVLGIIAYLIANRMEIKNVFIKVLVSSWVLGVVAAVAITLYDTPSIVRESESNIAKNCSVVVLVDDGHGSGFSISNDYVITNNHVIEGSKKITVHYDKDYPATITKSSKEKDIAVLKVENGSFPSCSLANSDEIKIGDDLFILGWPNDQYGEATVTKGIFSRRIPPEDAMRMGISESEILQTDASINSGNSGGPVVNDKGIIGMSVAKIQATDGNTIEGIGFVISSNAIAEYLK